MSSPINPDPNGNPSMIELPALEYHLAHVITIVQRSIDTANGLTEPDNLWALGATWRKLYPQLVQLISHGGLADHGRAFFRQVAVEMERIAFGPPAENLARIVALHRAGIVDFDWLAGISVRRVGQGRLL